MNKLPVISFAVALISSGLQIEAHSTIDILDIHKTGNHDTICVHKSQAEDNMSEPVASFIKMLYNRIHTHVLFFEELTYQESIGRDIALYKDTSGIEWYVQSAYRENFEQIASVVASRLHNAIASSDVSNVNVKFVVAQDSKTGLFYLAGAARERKDFKPIWGLEENIQLIDKPSNLEEEYAFWHFLGMPVPDPSFVGFDNANEKVVRVDFDTAFSQQAAEKTELNCFKTVYFRMNHYTCDPAKISAEVSRIASDPRVSEVLNQAEESLKLLEVADVDEGFQKIRLLLNK